MKKFLDHLVHHWHNIKQCQLNPTSFAYVHYEWYYEDDVLKTKQWYDWNGDVYRQREHKIVVDNDQIMLQTFKDGINVSDMTFTEVQDCVWVGKSERIDEQGRRVETKARLTKDSWETSDKGWDKSGTLLWGSEKGPFEFVKCTR